MEEPVSERFGDQRSGGVVTNPYFDINAFQPLPNRYTVTPEPAYLAELRAPSLRTINLTAMKAFPIGERFRFQIRMDAIALNLSNLATFGVIDSASGSRQMLGSVRLLF